VSFDAHSGFPNAAHHSCPPHTPRGLVLRASWSLLVSKKVSLRRLKARRHCLAQHWAVPQGEDLLVTPGMHALFAGLEKLVVGVGPASHRCRRRLEYHNRGGQRRAPASRWFPAQESLHPTSLGTRQRTRSTFASQHLCTSSPARLLQVPSGMTAHVWWDICPDRAWRKLPHSLALCSGVIVLLYGPWHNGTKLGWIWS
jgi:hypothetical protein